MPNLASKNHCFLLLAIVFAVNVEVSAKGKKPQFGTIYTRTDSLYFNFSIPDLLSPNILEGLQRGMTAAVEYHIQLWKVRSRWVDQLIGETVVRMKIQYDQWEKKYSLSVRLRSNLMSESEVQGRCSNLIDFPLTSLKNIDTQSRYFIGIRVVLQPITMENYNEIMGWLSGEIKELNPKNLANQKDSGQKTGSWLLGLVLNLTGFGEKIISAKSPIFSMQNETIVRNER